MRYQICEVGNTNPSQHSFDLPDLAQAKTKAAGIQRYSDTIMTVSCNDKVLARRYKSKWEIVQ